MLLKPLRQLWQSWLRMGVADRAPRSLPHLFLRIEIRGRRRQHHDLQAWIGGQDLAHGRPSLPGRPIPQQENRDVRMCGQNGTQVFGRRLGLHAVGLRYHRLPRVQVERAIKVGFASARIAADQQRLTPRAPTRHRSRLQIHGGFVFRHDDRIRGSLGHVDQFFSNCVSNSTTARSLRNVNTLVGRW